MAITFPNPAGQTPVNTFSPTSTPAATTNGVTYTYNSSLGVWTASSSGGVNGVTATAPIVSSGGTAPVISITAASTAAAGSIQLATTAEATTGTDALKALTPATGVPKDASGMAGAAIMPGGVNTARPGAPVKGMFRYNDQGGGTASMEYYDGSNWIVLVSGGPGNADPLGWFGHSATP